MLRFILQPGRQLHCGISFQYISCYGLSKGDIVLVYRLSEFQYISCYGLSRFFLFIVLTLTKFQYISCYGLSADAPVDSPADFISIHLMLRFIFSHFAHSSEEYLFQYISCYGLSFPKSNRRRRKNNFNTSHVTVYQKSSISSTIRKTISIHLMLRFIPRRRQYKKAK